MTDFQRLHPGGLVPGARSGSLDRHDPGGSLRERLRDDPMLGGHDAGSSSIYSTNMLKDPLLDRLTVDSALSIGTSWTAIGSQWEARYVPVAGGTPTVTAQRTTHRKVIEGGIYRTSAVVFKTQYAAAGEAVVEMRPKEPTPPSPHIDWPWVVMAARTYVDSDILTATNLVDADPEDYADDDDTEYDSANFVRLAVINGTSFPASDDDYDAVGDEVDIQELSDDRMEAQPYCALDTDAGGSYWWCLQIHTETSAAGGVAVGVAEPQANYSYQEAPLLFEPIIGNYDPNTDHPPLTSPEGADTEPSTDGGTWGTSNPHAMGEGLEFEWATWADLPIPWTNWGPQGSSAVHVGSAPGYETVRQSTGICTSDAWFKAFGLRYRECWYPYTVPAWPTNAAGVMVKMPGLASINQAIGNTYGSYHKQAGFQARASKTEPLAARSGNQVATFFDYDVTGGDVWVFVPIENVPPAGSTLWIGVAPNWDTIQGHPWNGPCWVSDDITATSYPVDDMKAAEAYGGTLVNSAPYWMSFTGTGQTPWPPPEGYAFRDYLVATADGQTATFQGVPTAEGTVKWYINGILTSPASLDESTGSVTFDRNPDYGAKITQYGMGTG